MGKTIWILGLVIMLLLVPVCPAAAQTTVIVDGKTLDSDVASVIEDGRTLVPLRAIFEALGAAIEWHESSQMVTATRGGVVIRLTIGDKTAYVGDKAVLLDVPGKILGGRTLVPVRFISESLGASTVWVPEDNRVEIKSGIEIPAMPDGRWMLLRELVEELGLEVTGTDDGMRLQSLDGTVIAFTRAKHGYEAVHGDTILRMMIYNDRAWINRDDIQAIGWLDDTAPGLQPAPIPAGDWFSLRELAESLNLAIGSSSDGRSIRIQHTNGSTIIFSSVGQWYEAIHGGTTLRIIRQDGQLMIDRRGLQEIGWL